MTPRASIEGNRSEPTVSVILPIYGDEPFLEASLRSLEQQSYTDKEVILIYENPSSTVRDTIDRFCEERRHFSSVNNQGGLTAALNEGIDRSDGKYVARQDADDISHEDRLRRQVEELEKDSELGIIGSNCVFVDADGEWVGSSYFPTTNEGIRWKCLYHNPFIHSGVTMRRETLRIHDIKYSERYPAAEDYHMWSQIIDHAKAKNLAKPYVRYQAGLEESVTNNRWNEMRKSHIRIAASQMQSSFSWLDRSKATKVAKYLHQEPDGFEYQEAKDVLRAFSEMYEGFSKSNTVNEEVAHFAAVDFAHSVKRNPLNENKLLSVARKLTLLNTSPASLKAVANEVRKKKSEQFCHKYLRFSKKQRGFDVENWQSAMNETDTISGGNRI